jgi:putative PEP-CTERM system histidine kinase
MLVVASLGYWIASLAFLALAIRLVTTRGDRQSVLPLILAAAATAGWAATLATQHFSEAGGRLVLFFEGLRPMLWLGLVMSLLPLTGWPRVLRLTGYAAILVTMFVVVAALTTGEGWAVSAQRLAAVLLSVLGLTSLEQAYRNSGEEARKPISYLSIGVGSMFAYDLLLQAHALALEEPGDALWNARGFAFAAVVPLIATGAKRMPEWFPRLFVSRQATFYSATLAAIILYILLVLAAGYAVRASLGVGAAVVQSIVYAGAAALLVAFVASRRWRRQFRVFILKNFYRHKYDYRDEWLRFIATLSDTSAHEDTRTSSVRAVAQIISSPSAVLLRYDSVRGRLHRIASWPRNLELSEPIEEVCQSARIIGLLSERQWVIDFREQRHGSPQEGELGLPAWFVNGRWRLIVPVLLRADLFGLLLLADPPGDFSLTFEDRDLLKTAARHVATHLAQHEAEQRVAEAQQFEAYAKLTAFMMHDLKNSVAQLQLLVANAARHRADPRFFEDAIETVDNASQRILRLIEHLRTGSLVARDEEVDVEDLIRRAVENCIAREPRPAVTVALHGLRLVTNRDKLSGVIQHIVRNAQDATPASGSVAVDARVEGERLFIEVSDTGVGMSPEFVRERLFRPFHSTKGSRGMGVGAHQAREYALSMGGDVEVRSEPGYGTVFRLILPVSTTSSND